jgi:hydrogenase maturation protein HypF
MATRRWIVRGQVQGVGFRPFVYRLAQQYQLCGWVKNLGGEVEIVAQGESAILDQFARSLITRAPPLAQPALSAAQILPAQDLLVFVIKDSAAQARPHIQVPPDYFTCDDCLAELRDPADRRYHYPFINCTQCGPRYTLIRRLPYDRPHTTLADFPLCPACAEEYHNPLDRRFHAQPLACPVCGPQLSWRSGNEQRDGAAALAAAVAALRAGQIIAVKGVGGYHLLCDARRDDSVARLRALKPRPAKPLALMCAQRGNDGLAQVRVYTTPTAAEAALLVSPARPIVLVAARPQPGLARGLAPGLAELGVMLPYSPLHHLLLDAFDAPLVATSANLSGEPVLTDNLEVNARLAHVAEGVLHHNRPIARPADDPVWRTIAGKPRPLRLGRGNAPLELALPQALAEPILAVGAHMKNTVALAWEQRVVISPHIGDLDSLRGLAVFAQVCADLQDLYQVRAARIACDAHPAYAASRWAKRTGSALLKVWHHHAHASALAGEYAHIQNWISFTWDGVGLGTDGSLWGGETLVGAPGQWRRFGHWRPFWLCGGDKVGRAPWRSAAALCWEAGQNWDAGRDTKLLFQAWQKHLNCVPSTAVGRLFDAAAALTGLCLEASYEGQGPMLLEAAAMQAGAVDALALPLTRAQDLWCSDWAALLPLLQDTRLSVNTRAAIFHASLALALRDQAVQARLETGIEDVGLCGGVFQNRLLSDSAVALLEAAGFRVHLPMRVPMNDAGLSFGQIIEAVAVQNAAPT